LTSGRKPELRHLIAGWISHASVRGLTAKMRKTVIASLLVLVLSAGIGTAQQPKSPSPMPPGYSQAQQKSQPQRQSTPQSQPPAQQPNAPVRFLGPPVTLYDSLQQAAAGASSDIGKLRIDRWKTDNSSKQQMQQVAESLTRNLNTALPGLLQQAR